MAETLKAPFPYFGGKSGAVAQVWEAFGDVRNYVEPFAGSAAMLLNSPEGKRVETINDFDGFVSNFWRAIAHDPDAVAHYADWPVNEADLFSRHSWLVRQTQDLTNKLHADPDFYDAKIAGYWCYGACSWIGSGWCSGDGPWVHDGENIVKRSGEGGVRSKLPHLSAGRGINRQLPHLSKSGQGINRKLPSLGDSGRGINRQLPSLGNSGRGINRATGTMTRSDFIHDWMRNLHHRLRDVRVTCGDWSRVVKDSVTTRHGLTAVFLDPPYEKGAMDYGAGGMGLGIAKDVQAWCAEHGNDPKLRIVLCGHVNEHDPLLAHGWTIRKWKARKGYALTAEAVANSAGETLWCSPHCVPEFITNQPLAQASIAQPAIKCIAQTELA